MAEYHVSARSTQTRTMVKTIGKTPNNKEFTKLTSDRWIVSLFPANVAPKADKKSFLKYNVSITDRKTGWRVQAQLRELLESQYEDGSKYILGQKAKEGFRALVSEYKEDAAGVKHNYEKLAVPIDDYADIKAMIDASDDIEATVGI